MFFLDFYLFFYGFSNAKNPPRNRLLAEAKGIRPRGLEHPKCKEKLVKPRKTLAEDKEQIKELLSFGGFSSILTSECRIFIFLTPNIRM